MNLLRKIRSFQGMLQRENGIHQIILTLRNKYGLPIPQSHQSAWKGGIHNEIMFWDSVFSKKEWTDSFGERFQPDLPMQPRPAALLPTQPEVHILDVGAGPLTFLGKKCEGKDIRITAVDPLADGYDTILEKHQVQPIVRTVKADAEKLTQKFAPDSFDLVVARNCIDHSYNPETAILQMIDVAKSGCYVLMEHRSNEAEAEKYQGLHQWNFSMNAEGDFEIGSKSQKLNFTQKHAKICKVTCETFDEGELHNWLVVRIQKL